MLTTTLRSSLCSRLRSGLSCQLRRLHPALPTAPYVGSAATRTIDTRIDKETIEHLERISLVDFANVRGIERLEEAISLADVIRGVNTDGVEPLYTVLEEETLYLRDDEAVEPESRQELLDLAASVEEDYYVAPQGNVPLITSADVYKRT